MFCILVSRVCLYYCLCRLASLAVSLSLDVRKQIKHKNVESMLPAVSNVGGVSDNIEVKLGSKWGFLEDDIPRGFLGFKRRGERISLYYLCLDQ